MVGSAIRGHVRRVSSRSVGVEEEFLLVEPESGQPRAVAGTVLAAARQAAGPAGAALEFELKQQQLETNSEPCRTLGELYREIRRGRAAAAAAAEGAGVRVAALATSPVPVEPQVVGTSRYRRMAEVFGLTAHEQLTCGCHVHVGISGDEEGVAVQAAWQGRWPSAASHYDGREAWVAVAPLEFLARGVGPTAVSPGWGGSRPGPVQQLGGRQAGRHPQAELDRLRTQAGE